MLNTATYFFAILALSATTAHAAYCDVYDIAYDNISEQERFVLEMLEQPRILFMHAMDCVDMGMLRKDQLDSAQEANSSLENRLRLEFPTRQKYIDAFYYHTSEHHHKNVDTSPTDCKAAKAYFGI